MSQLSRFGAIQHAVVQIFLCLNCYILVEIQELVSGLCLIGDVFDLLDDFQHRTILCDVHSLGMAGRVGVTWKRRVLEISVCRSLVKTSYRSEMAMPLCNMRSLGITGRVGSTSKSWETKKSWRYELVKIN